MIPRSDRMGQIFGSYELRDFLGQGGFAEVYRGVHTLLPQKQAAIKILIKQLVQTKSNQFEQEAQFISQFNHPNIVRLHDYGLYSNPNLTMTIVPYIVMDYVPKGSLRKNYPRGSRLHAPMVAAYIGQIAEALQYLHNNNVMHLDVKPENMLIGEQGQLLLADFGLARLFSGKDMLSDIQGTLSYMSPEHFDSNPGPGFASDQYALAVVAYEWLCGRVPFKGNSVDEIRYHHQNSLPPSLCAILPQLPSAVETVIMRALKKDPRSRYASVSDFARELAAAIDPAAVSVSPPIPVSVPVRPPDPQQPFFPSMPSVSYNPQTSHEPFFRTQEARPAGFGAAGQAIPGNPESMTIQEQRLRPLPPEFSQPYNQPYTSSIVTPVQEAPNKFLNQFFTDLIQPEKQNILKRQNARFYAGLGLHVLGALCIVIWFARLAQGTHIDIAILFGLLTLLTAPGLFALFFISRNQIFRAVVAALLVIYWALVGVSFAALTCLLFLLGSAGAFFWVLFGKQLFSKE